MSTHLNGHLVFPAAMADVLLAGGWKAGRKIAIDDWIRSLHSMGWPSPTRMQALLLESLGDLTLQPQGNQESQWNQPPIKVDPIAAAYVCCREDPDSDPARICCVEGIVGESLYPFAEYLVAAPVSLFTTTSGRLISAGSGIAHSYGNDFESSFHNFSKQTAIPNNLFKIDS